MCASIVLMKLYQFVHVGYRLPVENVVLMPSIKTPTIKGMFVQSHVEKLRKIKGDKAVAALEERFGRPAYFKRLEDVPVKDEVIIIEHVYDLLNQGHDLSPAARSRAAGRLHFTNFSETVFGSILMASMPHTKSSLRTMLFNIGTIAGSVIKHTQFQAEDTRHGVRIKLTHSHYPPEHFAGFFEEWLSQWNIPGTVSHTVQAAHVHEYTITMRHG